MHPSFSDGVGYRTATRTTKASDDIEFQLGDEPRTLYLGIGPVSGRNSEGYLYVYIPDPAAHHDTYKHPTNLREVSNDCMKLEAELEEIVQDVFDTEQSVTLVRDDRHNGAGEYFVTGIPPTTTIVPVEEDTSA